MTNVIRFLESLGSKPALSTADYTATVAALDADDAQRKLLLNRDCGALNDLIGGRERMVCSVWKPEEEPMHEDDQPEPETPAEDVPPDQD